MKYQLNTDDIFAFASFTGERTRRKGSELQFKRCPMCGGGNGDEWTFAINLESGACNCKRASCGYKAHFVQLCNDKGYRLEALEDVRFRKIKDPGEIQIRDVAIGYFAKRGISEATVRRFKVTTRADNGSVLIFPFYDEQNVLRFVKYRNIAFKKGDKGNKEFCESGTMPILFGMAQAKEFDKPLIITEGQIDSMSVSECGFENVVSVPTGALGFTWLRWCQDWMSKFPELIIFGDHEKGKITLVDQLTQRLKMPIKVVRKEDYLGEKDANDILRTFGKQAVIDCIKRAEPPKVSNVKDLADVEAVDINSLERIYTNIPTLDKAIGGLVMGQVVLLTGKRGEGKSTFMSQLICEALDQGHNVFAYSGELAAFHFKRWLDFQLAGKDNIDRGENMFGDATYSIPADVVERISKWYKGRAFIYDNEWDSTETEMESLPDTVEKVIRQYGCKLICIDNLMTAMDRVDDQNNLYLAQSNFVGRLKKIAVKFNVVIVLVAHPRKSNGRDFDNDDVSGSSDITNKVDVVLNYARAEENQLEDSTLQVSKNRLFGRLLLKNNAVRLSFGEDTKRIAETPFTEAERNKPPKRYGWENEKPTEPIDIEVDELASMFGV